MVNLKNVQIAAVLSVPILLKTNHIFLLECSQYDTLRLKYFSAMSDISTCSTIDENFILSILQCFDAELTILLMQFIHEAFLARREALKVN